MGLAEYEAAKVRTGLQRFEIGVESQEGPDATYTVWETDRESAMEKVADWAGAPVRLYEIMDA